MNTFPHRIYVPVRTKEVIYFIEETEFSLSVVTL